MTKPESEKLVESLCGEDLDTAFPQNNRHDPVAGSKCSDGSDFSEYVFVAETLQAVRAKFQKFLEAIKLIASAAYCEHLIDIYAPKKVRCEVRVPPEIYSDPEASGDRRHRLYFRAAFIVSQNAKNRDND